MCRDLERLYNQSCALVNHLYYRRKADPRYARLSVKAQDRQYRRGAALGECWDAEAESLARVEAEADYYEDRR